MEISMTQEERKLLLKDLCARLPYRVKFACNKNVYTAKGLDLIVTDEGDWEYAVTAKGITPIEIDFIKPYLFPLSSMTEEQEVIYGDLCYQIINATPFEIQNCFNELYNWLIKNNFDYQGLIPKGLAIDATGLNIYK